jgi:tryptophanyl-tRNA synthetase
MSLKDSRVKMSKSSKSEFSRINLMDSPEAIRDKITRAKTDSIGTIALDEARPEVGNLIRIFAEVKGVKPDEIERQFKDATIMQFKEGLSEALIEKLTPIRSQVVTTQTQHLLSNESELLRILASGRERARAVASSTMKEVKTLVGYLVP